MGRNHLVRQRATWELNPDTQLERSLHSLDVEKQQESQKADLRRQFRQGIVDPRSKRHLQRGPPDQVRRKFQAVNDNAARRIRNNQQKMQTQRQILSQLLTEMEKVGVPGAAKKLPPVNSKNLADDLDK